MQVGGAGGYRHLGQGGWEELAERLQGRRDVWQALMQAYAFYLLPVEQAMTLADARRSGALEWLHSKVRGAVRCGALSDSRETGTAR